MKRRSLIPTLFPYTTLFRSSGHSRRVKDYAVQIARLMGYDAVSVEKIGTAALLHDVGKIYDKYAPILAKEARLTPEERSEEHTSELQSRLHLVFSLLLEILI